MIFKASSATLRAMASARKPKPNNASRAAPTCAMRLRIYPGLAQENRIASWLSNTHRFRNEAVAFVTSRRRRRAAWIRQHKALSRGWIPEEFSGNDAVVCSKWLTGRLEAARYLIRLEGHQGCSKAEMSQIVAQQLKQLTRAEREELPDAWLLSLPRTALDQVIQDIKKTLSNAICDRVENAKRRRQGQPKLKRLAGFPGFHKWSYPGSVRVQVAAAKNTSFRAHWAAGEVFVPGLGRLRFRDQGYQSLPATPPSLITVSRGAAGHFYVSFACAPGEGKAARQPGNLYADQQAGRPVAALPLDTTTGLPKCAGLDLGLTDRTVDSNGQKSGRVRHLKRYARNLRTQNKTLARRQRGSGRWLRAKQQLGRTHVRVVNCREAMLRQEARQIVKDNAIICLETIFLGFMLQNRFMAFSAHDAALGLLQQCLVRECAKQGHLLLRCGRFDASTKTCSQCGQVNPKLNLNDRAWTCSGCDTLHDRDINAAVNIRGMALQKAISDLSSMPENGVGVLSSHPLKPELVAFVARGGLTALLAHTVPVKVAGQGLPVLAGPKPLKRASRQDNLSGRVGNAA